MSNIFKTEKVKNNKLVVDYHKSHEDAVRHLSRQAISDWINGVSLKGMSPDRRCDILLENLPTLIEELEKAKTLPKEYMEL